MEIPNRTCGVCGVRDIPRGIEWPWWLDGECVHYGCLALQNVAMVSTLRLALSRLERLDAEHDGPDEACEAIRSLLAKLATTRG